MKTPIPVSHRHIANVLASKGTEFTGSSLFMVISFLLSLRGDARSIQAGILALVGKPGQGKSLMLECVAAVLGVKVIRISLADCESRGAGEPAAKVRAAGVAGHRLQRQGFIVLIVIEDADIVLADAREGEGATTNRSQLIGVIQELVDGRCTVDGQRLGRQFFAFTMNNTTRVRKSLLRHMRCLVVEHAPSIHDRKRIASNELSGLLPKHVLARQAKRLAQMTIAEIAAVKTQLRHALDHMIAIDMAWTPYQAWLANKDKACLIDAVGRRVLTHRHIKDVIHAVKQQSENRQSYL
jgi:SpoVK/Ycf46/Vps4 family AAA+-type ATPase